MEDCICATATPLGNGGISVIRLSGSRAIGIADKVVRCRRGCLAETPSHRLKFVEFVVPAAAVVGSVDASVAGGAAPAPSEVLDEGVVSLFRAPHSYTGEDVVEFSCHASPYIVRRLLEALVAAGARMAGPGEFTKRAFLNGKMDLSQAEAVADLIASENKASHDVAFRQLRGGVSNEMAALRDRLVEFAALVELELDFSEEDVEFADRSALRTLLDEIAGRVAALRQSFATGLALKEGVPVVLVGRPNAGKSTLLNALLREERALVSDIPGTTRDTIEDVWELEGVKYRFIDTAGLHASDDPLEQAGMARTKEKMRRSRLWLYLFDATTVSESEARAEAMRWCRELMGGGADGMVGAAVSQVGAAEVAGDLAATDVAVGVAADGGGTIGEHPAMKRITAPVAGGGTADAAVASVADDAVARFGQAFTDGLSTGDICILMVGNKIDRLPGEDLVRLTGEINKPDVIYLSAKTGQGMEALEARIKACNGLRLSENETILTNARHAEVLGRLADTLDRIIGGLTAGLSGDLLAQDIREALRHIGEITGEVYPDELLGTIFSRFCIGK